MSSSFWECYLRDEYRLSPYVTQIRTHFTISAPSKALAATSSSNDHASMGHSGQRIGKTRFPVLPSSSLDCRNAFRHCRQYACSWGQGRRRPNGRRVEEVGPFETVAGLAVIRNDSKHIPQVGGPAIVFVGGFVEALALAGAFPLPFIFGSCAAELDWQALRTADYTPNATRSP